MEYWETIANNIKYAKVSPYGLFNGVEIVVYPSKLDGNYRQDFDYHLFSQLLEEHVKNKSEQLCFPYRCYCLKAILKQTFGQA